MIRELVRRLTLLLILFIGGMPAADRSFATWGQYLGGRPRNQAAPPPGAYVVFALPRK